MPASDIGQVVDELLGPVGTLDLGEGAAAASGAEASDGYYGEAAVGGEPCTGERGVGVHVGQVAVIGMASGATVARVAELIFAIESAAELIDDAGSGNPGPVGAHHHRFGMSKRVPVILGGGIILRSQSFVIADEVFSANGVLGGQVVVDFGEPVVEFRGADGRHGIRNGIAILKNAGVGRIFGAIPGAVIDEAGHFEAEVFRRSGARQRIAGIQYALGGVAYGGASGQSQRPGWRADGV